MSTLLQRFAFWLLQFCANANPVTVEDDSAEECPEKPPENTLRPTPAGTYAKAINGEHLTEADIDAVLFDNLDEL